MGLGLSVSYFGDDTNGCPSHHLPSVSLFKVGSQKLCKDKHNFTVTIEDKLYHSQSGYRDYLVNYQNSKSFTGFGMLVKIEGKF